MSQERRGCGVEVRDQGTNAPDLSVQIGQSHRQRRIEIARDQDLPKSAGSVEAGRQVSGEEQVAQATGLGEGFSDPRYQQSEFTDEISRDLGAYEVALGVLGNRIISDEVRNVWPT